MCHFDRMGKISCRDEISPRCTRRNDSKKLGQCSVRTALIHTAPFIYPSGWDGDEHTHRVSRSWASALTDFFEDLSQHIGGSCRRSDGVSLSLNTAAGPSLVFPGGGANIYFLYHN